VKALRLHGVGDLRLHDEPDPTPGDGDVLVRVTAVGLCGSDRHWLVEGGIGDAVLTQPLVLGHEFAGTIESGSRAGERVAVDPAIPCGGCGVCLSGQPHLCLTVRFAGHGSTDGALCTLMAWPEELAYPLPDSLSDAEGALLEPLGIALHALDLGRVGPGASAGVFGCGPIGLLLVQVLRAAGATVVVATDPLPHRLAAAAAMGATHAPGAGEALPERLSGRGGFDVAFEAAGEDAALADAIEAVRPGGRVVLVGIPDGDRTSFTASAARRKGLTLLLARRMKPADLPRAIRLAEAGRVELGSLVTERYPLTQGGEAFEALVSRRGLKVVVEPTVAGPTGRPRPERSGDG
jgi:L-iditol 2-dehydrogenase